MVIDLLFWAGAETQLRHLAIGLRERGYEVTLLAIDDATSYVADLDEAGVELRVLGVKSRGGKLRALPEMTRLARRADLVHCTGWDASLWGRLAAIAARRPAAGHRAHRGARLPGEQERRLARAPDRPPQPPARPLHLRHRGRRRDPGRPARIRGRAPGLDRAHPQRRPDRRAAPPRRRGRRPRRARRPRGGEADRPRGPLHAAEGAAAHAARRRPAARAAGRRARALRRRRPRRGAGEARSGRARRRLGDLPRQPRRRPGAAARRRPLRPALLGRGAADVAARVDGAGHAGRRHRRRRRALAARAHRRRPLRRRGDEDGFLDACERLLGDADLRQRLSEAGAAGAADFDVPRMAERYARVFEAAIAGARCRTSCPSRTRGDERHPSPAARPARLRFLPPLHGDAGRGAGGGRGRGGAAGPRPRRGVRRAPRRRGRVRRRRDLAAPAAHRRPRPGALAARPRRRRRARGRRGASAPASSTCRPGSATTRAWSTPPGPGRGASR